VPRLRHRTIDVHCHLATPAVEQLVAGLPSKVAEAAASRNEMGQASFDTNVAQGALLLPQLTSVECRLVDMDAMGVDVQVLSPSPAQFYYWAEEDLADAIVELQNEAIATICGNYPERFCALGAVALQHPAHAARQLRQLVRERGFKGVEVSTLINGRDIADRFFDPFWTAADELGAIVFVHPWGSSLGSRLSEHYLMNSIGQPLEHTICLSKLIFGGTLDRHPGVKIVAAHGGGYLPGYVHRSDHAHAVRPEARGCQCRPSDYLRRIWFDSIVYETDNLRRLIEVVGNDRVVVGTDYPFDMGHYDPSGLVFPLDEETQRLILGANAEALLQMQELAT
jgi:aminocarboxymuconate-semialdehyde decarboxylase